MELWRYHYLLLSCYMQNINFKRQTTLNSTVHRGTGTANNTDERIIKNETFYTSIHLARTTGHVPLRERISACVFGIYVPIRGYVLHNIVTSKGFKANFEMHAYGTKSFPSCFQHRFRYCF